MTASLNVRYYMASQPKLTDEELVDGDLCDVTVGRRYCQDHATSVAVDADGGTRILCAYHTAMFFPTSA